MSSVNDIKKNWYRLNVPAFLQYDFLYSFYIHNPSIKHLFNLNKDYILYAQVFKLKLFKTLNYSRTYSFIAYMFSFFKIQVLYLGNCYLTNFSFFSFHKTKDIHEIISNLKQDWCAVIVPDFIMRSVTNQKKI